MNIFFEIFTKVKMIKKAFLFFKWTRVERVLSPKSELIKRIFSCDLPKLNHYALKLCFWNRYMYQKTSTDYITEKTFLLYFEWFLYQIKCEPKMFSNWCLKKIAPFLTLSYCIKIHNYASTFFSKLISSCIKI